MSKKMDVVVVNSSSPAQGLSTFFEMLGNQAKSCRSVGEDVAEACGVPYDAIGPDPDRLHWPDSFNDALEAAEKISKLSRMYWHAPSLNLVLVDESGMKVGIRSTSLSTFGIPHADKSWKTNLISRFGKADKETI